MIFLRSWLFNILFYLGTLAVSVIFIPTLLNRKATHIVSRFWARYSLFLAKYICGITYEIRGAENKPKTACLIASKHQSAWETIAYWILLHDPVYVLKKELLKLPFYGLYLRRTGNIAVDREGGGKALKAMLASAKGYIAQGRSIVIFPEGTRTAVGAKHDYHPGVAALYSQLDVPLVPVALNSGCYWPRNAYIKKPGRIVIEYLTPIAPGIKSREVMAELQSRIEAATDKLVEESEKLA